MEPIDVSAAMRLSRDSRDSGLTSTPGKEDGFDKLLDTPLPDLSSNSSEPEDESRLSLQSLRSVSSSVEDQLLYPQGAQPTSRTARIRSSLGNAWRFPSLDWRNFSLKPLFGWQDLTPHRSSATAWLDGLRGVAALQVFFFHFFGRYTSWGHSYGSTPEDKYIHQLILFRPIYFGGSGAVSIFFVISGYVITFKCLSLLRERNYEGMMKSLCSSFFRRLFRLYGPVLIAAIPVLIMVRTVTMEAFFYSTEIKDTWGEQFVHFLNATDNHINPFAYKDNHHGVNRYAYAPVSWTIPMEYYGSVVCYSLVVITARVNVFAIRCLMLGLVAFGTAHQGCWWASNFVIGMMIADWTIERSAQREADMATKPRLVTKVMHDGAFFAVFCIGTYISGIPPRVLMLEWNPCPRVGYDFLYDLIPPDWLFKFEEKIRWYWFWTGNLTVLGISQVPWMQAIFTTKFCQYLGKISFSLYLAHAPVIASLSPPIERFLAPLTKSNGVICWVQFGLQLPVILILAALIERLADAPSVRFAKWLEGVAFQEPREKKKTVAVQEAGDGQEMVGLMSRSGENV